MIPCQSVYISLRMEASTFRSGVLMFLIGNQKFPKQFLGIHLSVTTQFQVPRNIISTSICDWVFLITTFSRVFTHGTPVLKNYQSFLFGYVYFLTNSSVLYSTLCYKSLQPSSKTLTTM